MGRGVVSDGRECYCERMGNTITLQQLHDAEISGQIDWLFDTAWHVEIGKPVLASATVSSEQEALAWLGVKAKELFGWEPPERGETGANKTNQ